MKTQEKGNSEVQIRGQGTWCRRQQKGEAQLQGAQALGPSPTALYSQASARNAS